MGYWRTAAFSSASPPLLWFIFEKLIDWYCLGLEAGEPSGERIPYSELYGEVPPERGDVCALTGYERVENFAQISRV